MRQARRLTGSCPTIRDRNRHGRPCCGEVGWVKDGRHMAIQPDITRSGDGSRTDRRPGASHWTGCRGDRHGGRAGAATALRLKMFLHDTQGSSFLATLGFGPESLWDSMRCFTTVVPNPYPRKSDIGYRKSQFPHVLVTGPLAVPPPAALMVGASAGFFFTRSL